MPKVSVVIPSRNSGRLLVDCMESVVNQTMSDIEIILIDDASDDESAFIARDYAMRDDRVRLIHNEISKGTSQGRKDGVMVATGEYVMFVDADDMLEHNACEVLYEAIKTTGVDILHFDARVVNAGDVDPLRIEQLSRVLAPYRECVLNGHVLEACLLERKFQWELWNKVFSRPLCVKAFSHVEDGLFSRGEDLYAFFILAYYAASYAGVSVGELYNYRFGAGLSGHAEVDLARFRTFCTAGLVADAVDSFAASVGGETITECAKEVRFVLVGESVWTWKDAVCDADAGAAMELLLDYWPMSNVVGQMALLDEPSQCRVSMRCQGSWTHGDGDLTPVGTVGVFCPGLAQTDLASEAREVIAMISEMGFATLLITDDLPAADQCGFPGETECLTVAPPSAKRGSFCLRASSIASAVEHRRLDTVIYFGDNSPTLFADILALKLLDVVVLLRTHRSAVAALMSNDDRLVSRLPFFRLADQVVGVEASDGAYYNAFGVPAISVPPLMERSAQRGSGGEDAADEGVSAHRIEWECTWRAVLTGLRQGRDGSASGNHDIAVERLLDLVILRHRLECETKDSEIAELTNQSEQAARRWHETLAAKSRELTAVYSSRSWRWSRAALTPLRASKAAFARVVRQRH